MKKVLFLTILSFLVFSFNLFSQTRLDSFYVKYTGTSLKIDSMIIYSKPEKLKIHEFYKNDLNQVLEKITLLLEQELIVITEDEPGIKKGISISMDEPHNEILNKINFISPNNYKDYAEPVGQEMMLGYPCNVYKNDVGNKIWVYKDIYILKVVDVNEETETIAYDFNPDAFIDESIFQISSEVKINYIKNPE